MHKILKIVLGVLVILAAAYYAVVTLFVPGYIRQMLPDIEAMAQNYINGSVRIGGVVWHGGLTAEVDDVVITDADGAKVANLPKTVVSLRPWQAVGAEPARVISRVVLEAPQVYLTMGDNGQWNLQHFLKPSESSETPFYGLLEIKGGQLEVVAPYGKWSFGIDGSVSGGANPKFAVDANIKAGEDTINVTGLVTTAGIGTLNLKADAVNIAPYAGAAVHYAKEYAQLDKLAGRVSDLRLTWKNDGKKVQLSGEGHLAGVGGTVKIAAADNKEHHVSVDGFVYAADNKLTVETLDAIIDGQKLHAEGSVDLDNLEKIRGEGLITAPALSYENWQARDIKLPLELDGDAVQIKRAQIGYGGGVVTASGTYDLKEKSLIADVNLKNVLQKLPDRPNDDIKLSGAVAVLAKQTGEKLLVHAAADTVDINWRSLHINRIALDGDYKDGALNIEHFSALADKGSLAASGMVEADGALKLHGRMAEFPIDPFLDVAGLHGSGLCSTGFDIGGTVSAPEFSGTVQLTDVDFMEQKITEAHGHVDLKNNIVTLKDLTANMQQGQHIVNGTIDIRGSEPVIDAAVETRGVRAEPIMALVYPELKVTGNVDNVIQMRGSLSHPYVYGEVELTDGSAEGYLLDKVAGRYVYEDGLLVLKKFTINALSTEVTLDGTMTRDQQLDFTMVAHNISMDRMPLMDKEFDIDGYVNADGQLTGTLQQPHFNGQITSDELKINGERLTEISGDLVSDGRETNRIKASFKQPYEGSDSDYGIFSAELNLNIPQRFIQGDIYTAWGKLGSILRMAKLDYDVDGIAQGEIHVNPKGKGSGVDIAVWVDDVKVHDLNYYRMNFNGHIKQNVLYFDNVKLMEQDGVTDKGVIAVNGQVDFGKRNVNVDLDAVQANPAIATALMKDPPVITGMLDMQAHLDGSFDNLEGSAGVVITNGAVSGVGVDKLVADLTLRNDNIRLHEMSAIKDVYSVRASGDIPVDLFRSADERRNPNAQMKIVMDLDEARLGILPAMTKMVEWGIGDTKGKVTVSGTLEAPLLYGSIKIDDGSLKIKDLSTVIDKIHTDIEFAGNKILLHDLSAQLGKGTVAIDGSYALRTGEGDTYRLHIAAKDAELASEIFTGRINSDVEIVPQRYLDFSRQQGNEPPPFAYRPQIKGSVRLDDVLVNMPTVPELGEGSSNIGMDIKVELGPKIHFFNKYLYDMWLSGGMQVQGSTLFPRVEGTIRADRGTITYLRTPFKLTTASVAWPVTGTFLPTVNLEGEARFSRYDIFCRVNGPVEEMELKLTSNPPLEQNTIIRMLTLQRDAGGSDDVTSEDMQNLMTAGLQMIVLGDVEMMVKQTLGLDQFRIYTGRTRTGIGVESMTDSRQELTPDERNQYNILVSKYVTRHLMLGYTTSFDGIDRSIFGQYDISRHFNLTYSRSYDLSDQAENWYGVEYKVTFK